MQTASRGNAAEAAVLNAFTERGFDVLVPFGEGQPYDLVVHLAPDAFVRVQCKTAWPCAGGLIFNSRTTDHGRGRLPYIGVADIFGVYFPPLRSVYLVPVREVPNYVVSLRLEPARNNQRRRIRLATDYEFDSWSTDRLLETTAVSTRAPA